MVVLGHCIQFGSGNDFLHSESFFYDTVFKWIYSYHMALFMLVSGYLFGLSVSHHSFRELYRSRFFQLLVPIISWGFVAGLLALVVHHEAISSIWHIIKIFGAHVILDLWFVWAIFYCSLVVLAVHHWLKDSVAVHTVVYLLLFVTPDALNFHLYKYMYPFFVAGYYAFKGQWLKKAAQYKKMIFAGAFVSYILLLSHFSYDSYIYTSMYTIIDFKTYEVHIWQLANDIYRMIVAALGSVCIMIALKYIWDKSLNSNIWCLFQRLGRASLIIYIFSGILNILLQHITSKLIDVNYMINIIETVIIIAVSYAVYLIIKRYHVLNTLFLGGR